jgi:glutamate racemase
MTHLPPGPIGIFDSGYGGLTVYREIAARMPQYDYLYLGDNARTPYGTRSFQTIYDYTWECVQALFAQGCSLVVLACNTASAKALRSIQQQQLPRLNTYRRVLGVIRPTTEQAGLFTRTGHLGILATPGTVASDSYPIEIAKLFPQVRVHQQACPMWVPLVENGEHDGPGADYFVEKYLQALLRRAPQVDAVVLACTHYPLLLPKIRAFLPPQVRAVAQGALVAERLEDYLLRHPEMAACCSRNGSERFLTTEDPAAFEGRAEIFLGRPARAERWKLH